MRIFSLFLLCLASSACVRYTCPAYQSYFDYEEAEEQQVASADEINDEDATFGTKDAIKRQEKYGTTESVVDGGTAADDNENNGGDKEVDEQRIKEENQARRDEHGLGTKFKKRKKWQRINTVKMQVNWPTKGDGQDSTAAGGDSTAVGGDEAWPDEGGDPINHSIDDDPDVEGEKKRGGRKRKKEVIIKNRSGEGAPADGTGGDGGGF